MQPIDDIAALEALYGTPGPAALRKVAGRLTPEYAAWIGRSRFCILTTVGPEGTDSSPRGDAGAVAVALDAQLLALPDRKGNDRIDSLRNIVRDGRVSLLFMVPGSNNVVRVNGRAVVTADPALKARFAVEGAEPRSVIVVTVGEVYFQCARALMRARLWSGADESAGLPTPGQILAEMTGGEVGGPDYDAKWPDRAAGTMW